jgi:capsular exopolysaccharide synthesis family protein
MEEICESPVLAAIPTINPNGAISFIKRNQNTKNSYAEKLIPNLNKSSHIYDAYRALQINFAFVNHDRVLKSILVTSPGPGEGKTLTAINMAQVFSGNKVKTLLVDCDLRRPMVHKVLAINDEPGLTNVLINKVTLEQVIHKFQNEYLYVLSCGKLPPNPSEILDTSKMRELLAQFKNEYDLIILDSPPLIAVTDALVLSTMVDGVCLVIKSSRTSQEAALKAKQLLKNSRTRIIGTILNDINLKDIYGYYKDYYYSNNASKSVSNAI